MMGVLNWNDIEPIKIEKFPYRGKMRDVQGISVSPEYGLRHFTAEPNGEIPIHNHLYYQTVYILSGEFECYRFDPETDDVVEKSICRPGDAIYAPSMEPHGMKNTSETEPATFLCCICNVYEKAL